MVSDPTYYRDRTVRPQAGHEAFHTCTPQEGEACLRTRLTSVRQAILVMKSAGDRFRQDVMAVSNPVRLSQKQIPGSARRVNCCGSSLLRSHAHLALPPGACSCGTSN
jgi:hypothetical protein